MKPQPGDKRVFAYPAAFHSLPEYSARRGQVVAVVRELSDAEADTGFSATDPEYEPMFEIEADDGWRGRAWLSELVPSPPNQ